MYCDSMENKKYSILLICTNGIPGHIIRFIRNLKNANPSVCITFFSKRSKEWFPEELDFYLDDFIQLKKYTGWPHRLWIFRGLFDYFAMVKQFKELARSHHYDIVNIHFPQYYLDSVMHSIRRMSNCIIVSPWGSDVLRVADKEKKRLRRVIKKADYITVGSTGFFGKVLCQEMKIDKEKFHPLAWGSETIDYINGHLSEISTEQAKESLGLSGRYLITCGYNAFESQKHETIINAINDKRIFLPDNMTLMFPVTYGTAVDSIDKKYIGRLKVLCEDLNLSTVFYENYLSLPDTFLLRRATDMFIHIQPSDGGNSSLQEYVLCGAKVVHGAWIHYNYLEQFKPLFYFPVNDLNELGDVIVDAYRSEPIRIPEQVIAYISNRGWKAKMMLWNDFFVSCLKG